MTLSHVPLATVRKRAPSGGTSSAVATVQRSMGMVHWAVEEVLVLATATSDRTRVRELLAESGLAPNDGEGAPAGRARALVICHRASAGTPLPVVPATCTDSDRVVVLSDRLDEVAIVSTLEAGAHHYFDIDDPSNVLRTRLVAALRSHSACAVAELSVSPYRFDLGKRRVWYGERPVSLSPKEFDLAFYLFSHRGRVVGNSELLTAIWSLPRTMDTRRIDTAACRVRRKMRLDASGSWRLRRLRGKGYVLTRAGDEAADAAREGMPGSVARHPGEPTADRHSGKAARGRRDSPSKPDPSPAGRRQGMIIARIA